MKTAAKAGLLFLACLFVCAGDRADSAPPPKQPQPAKNSPQAKRGLALIKAQQCLTCHTMDGAGAEGGVSLDHLHRTRSFIIQHLLDPEASVAKNGKAFGGDPNLMPQMQLSKEEAGSIADYLLAANPVQTSAGKNSETGAAALRGKELYNSLNCVMCHSISSAGGCMGPPLGAVTKRRTDNYLRLRLGKSNEAQFVKLIKHDELFPHPRFASQDVSALIAYLHTLSATTPAAPMTHATPASVKPDDVAGGAVNPSPEGRRLIVEMGCLSCHSISQQGGSLAPKLDGVGQRRSREYIESHIFNPDAHFKRISQGKQPTKMVNPGLFPQEVKSITEYLMSLPPQ